MAYVLGFFAADGSMLKNKRGGHFIEFHITDREVIESIKTALGSGHKISSRAATANWKTLYRLQIGSKEIYADLEQLGFSQAKSKKMRLPMIPKKYLGDFVRGYFDGDGNIYFKQHHAADRKNLRWVFSSRFTSGSKLFLSDLHEELSSIMHGGFIVAKRNGENVSGYDLVFSHNDSVALFQLMYNNGSCNLFLTRKYDLFKKAVETLYPKRA